MSSCIERVLPLKKCSIAVMTVLSVFLRLLVPSNLSLNVSINCRRNPSSGFSPISRNISCVFPVSAAL